MIVFVAVEAGDYGGGDSIVGVYDSLEVAQYAHRSSDGKGGIERWVEKDSNGVRYWMTLPSGIVTIELHEVKGQVG
jgi:hypothetical protein